MYNLNFTKKLTNNKTAILNFFAEISPNFYFNFLNDNEYCGKMHIGTREQWSGCHCRVQYYENHGKAVVDGVITDKDFKEYSSAKAYYISFNAYNDYRTKEQEKGFLSVSIREDVIKYWLQTETSNCSILFVSTLDSKIYEMPVKNVIQYVCAHKNECLVSYNGFNDYIIPVCNDTVSRESQMICDSLLPMSFQAGYYKPEHIANHVFTFHRRGTSVKAAIFSKDGSCTSQKIFRSLSELYDKLAAFHLYSKSKKTLQRRAADELPIILDNGFKLLISSDLEKTFDDITVIVKTVVDEYTQNPFFNKDEQEDEQNPRYMPTLTHREAVMIKEPRKNWKEHFDEIQEFEEHDDEEEMETRDCIEEAKNLIKIKEKQEEYIKALADFHKKLAMDIKAERPHIKEYIEEKPVSLF